MNYKEAFEPLDVLLVEDNPHDVYLYTRMLCEASTQPSNLVACGSLAEAADALRRQSFDIALLDISLPDADGLESLAAIQTQAPHLPIVVLSGNQDEAIALQALNEGAQDYLVKGQVDSRLMLRAIRYAMERKLIYAELQEARQTAEANTQAKSDFLASMTHELKTPLQSIIGFSEIIYNELLGPIGNPEYKKQVKDIHSASLHLLDLINDLLEFSALEAHKISLEKREFNLRSLVNEITHLFAYKATQRSLVLASQLCKRTPETVIGDPKRLRQVLINLIGNAIKFTPSGSIKLSVEREDSTGGEICLRFSVSDTGIGIPPGVQQKIFEKFMQASPKFCGKDGGSGLGLAICKELVDLMGGEIAVYSREGEGSTFSFTANFLSPSPPVAKESQLQEQWS